MIPGVVGAEESIPSSQTGVRELSRKAPHGHAFRHNVIERSFKEVKRRTRVVGRFPNETSALVMVFSILNEERLKWQKVRMRADDIAWIEEAARALEEEPIRLEFLEEALVA